MLGTAFFRVLWPVFLPSSSGPIPEASKADLMQALLLFVSGAQRSLMAQRGCMPVCSPRSLLSLDLSETETVWSGVCHKLGNNLGPIPRCVWLPGSAPGSLGLVCTLDRGTIWANLRLEGTYFMRCLGSLDLPRCFSTDRPS